MTTPNSYTRQALSCIAGDTANAVTELNRVLPHMRSVANSLTGHHAAAARQAVQRAEQAQRLLAEADREAEAAKTLFRSATAANWQSTPAPPTPSITLLKPT